MGQNDVTTTDPEWEARKAVERRFAHAHRRRFGLDNTPEERKMRDQWAFLASFVVVETVRTLDRWAAPESVPATPEPTPEPWPRRPHTFAFYSEAGAKLATEQGIDPVGRCAVCGEAADSENHE